MTYTLVGVVVSSKRDLKNLKSIDFSDGAEFAKSVGMTFVEVSSVSCKPFYVLILE